MDAASVESPVYLVSDGVYELWVAEHNEIKAKELKADILTLITSDLPDSEIILTIKHKLINYG